MVIVLEEYPAETPDGKPEELAIPVTPDVVWVTLVMSELIQGVGLLDAAPTEQAAGGVQVNLVLVAGTEELL